MADVFDPGSAPRGQFKIPAFPKPQASARSRAQLAG